MEPSWMNWFGLKKMKTSCLVALLLIAVPLIAFSQTMGTRTVTIKIEGPAVIGFFPPVKQLGDNNPDDGVIEVTGQLSDALDNTGECLKKSGITAQVSLETASTLVVKENGAARRIVLPKSWAKAAGVYLFKPGAPARVIYVEKDPSSLITKLPQTAAEYFPAPGVWKRQAHPLTTEPGN
jgi:hypothetical protein